MWLESKGYRALDLTDIRGALCGKMLAFLGIDVIKVEPPEGSPERHLGPFYKDRPDSEGSLWWLAYNGNKRGITLDITTSEGRDLLLRLVEKADFLIESFAPRYLDRLGLGYEVLHGLNPSLIFTSITPFGQTGPYAEFVADDITLQALGGMQNLNGDSDRAPLRFSVEQAFPQSGAQAAAATMIAHHYRRRTGRGQRIDLSMQEAVVQTIFLEQHFWDVAGVNERREGSGMERMGVNLQMVYPCADGLVAWRIYVGSMGRRTQPLVDWMKEEGAAGVLANINFSTIDMNQLSASEVDLWQKTIGAFFLKHTKDELHRGALERGIMLFPATDAHDLLNDRHLAERAFWVEVEHPEWGASLTYPGRPYKLSPPQEDRQRRAPLLGEHNREVYCGELGLSSEELASLRQKGVI